MRMMKMRKMRGVEMMVWRGDEEKIREEGLVERKDTLGYCKYGKLDWLGGWVGHMHWVGRSVGWC